MSSKTKGKGKVPTLNNRVVARDYENGGSPSTVTQAGHTRELFPMFSTVSMSLGLISPVDAPKKGNSTQTAISIPSEDEDEEEEDEDDFEEVPIPNATAGPSSQPGTPSSAIRPGLDVDTPGTNTTAPSVDDDFEEFAEDDEEAEEGGGDGIIRVELGGESAEAKAKRIALALRR